ncbi:MAG TPA: 50S ribosomal protein L29 [Rhodospirillaceae bacterium]|nr:50S ribosomal protein L29 [Rhodospirillaceae bacterium]
MAKTTKNLAKDGADALKGKSSDELNTMLVELRKQQMDMRFQQAGGQLTNTAEIRKVRRTIARVKTYLGQQEAAQAAQAK